jgi:putative intracellular protease/amidase
MKEKGTVLVVGSNARILRLKNDRTFPTGNYLNELVTPMQMLLAAGYQLVVATPDGTKPPLDPRSLAASHFAGDEAAMKAALAFYESHPSLDGVVTLRAIIDPGLEHLDGIFVPGGHAPITDLAANPDLGIILRHAHQHGKPTALLCHGPIALLAAMPAAPAFQKDLIDGDRAGASVTAGEWPYRGYRMTIFSNSEEKLVETNVTGAPLQYPVADALALAGGSIENGPDYESFTVTDRELITGQNPHSDRDIATHLIAALNARIRAV